ICVMREGRIIQVGTPHEVYYQPVDGYVARFFGDNNLVEGRLGPEDGDARVIETAMGTFRAAVAGAARSASDVAGRPIAMVVRPEAIRPLAADERLDNRLEVRIESISFSGPSSEIRIRPVTEPERVLNMRIPSSAGQMPLQPGQVVRVGWSTVD